MSKLLVEFVPWDKVDDKEDLEDYKQGDCLAVMDMFGEVHKVYFCHEERKGYVGFQTVTPDEIKDIVRRVIEAFGYTAMEVY